MTTPKAKLNSGHQMPLVGFGLWKVNNNTCADQVYNAIKVGYRLFDGACDYGNEKEAGEGIRRAINDGLVSRSDLFITSKLWGSFHDPKHVAPACRLQLKDWGLDYFDLYLIHFPIALAYVDPSNRYPPGWEDESGKAVTFAPVPLHRTWVVMEELVDQGLAHSIGVSNYCAALIVDLLRYARIRPAVLQIEHHPYLAQPKLVEYCNSEGIAVTAYSSFGPQSFIEIDFELAKSTPPLLEHEVVKKIADRQGKTPAQVLLRWATQRAVAVIPKSNNPERLKQNLDVCSFNLTEQDMKELGGLDKGLRFNDPPTYDVPAPIFA